MTAPGAALLFVRVRIMAMMFVMSFIGYLLRTSLSAATPNIGDEFFLSSQQIGWVIGSFNFSYVLFQIPSGMFGDRLGPRRALTLCAITWGVLTFLTGFAPYLFAASATGAIVSLVIVRCAMGVAQAPLFPVSAVVIARWFPPGHWALPNGALNTALTLGQTAMGPIVTYLIVRYGWRESFYILSPTALFAAALWWWYARDRPREHPSVSSQELAFIESGVLETDADPPRSFLNVLRNRNVALLTLAYFCSNYVFYIFSNWLIVFLVKQRGYSLLESGLLSALPFLAGAVLASVGGWTCDVLCRRMGATWGCRIPGIFGLTMVAAFLLGGVYATDPYLALTSLALCFGFQQFTEGAFWAGTMLAADGSTGTGTGVLNTGGNLPGFLAPLVGYMVDQLGWLTSFASGAIFALAGAVVWLFVRLSEEQVSNLRLTESGSGHEIRQT
jgi:MFS transporter, ACS family, glucarate transporter